MCSSSDSLVSVVDRRCRGTDDDTTAASSRAPRAPPRRRHRTARRGRSERTHKRHTRPPAVCASWQDPQSESASPRRGSRIVDGNAEPSQVGHERPGRACRRCASRSPDRTSGSDGDRAGGRRVLERARGVGAWPALVLRRVPGAVKERRRVASLPPAGREIVVEERGGAHPSCRTSVRTSLRRRARRARAVGCRRVGRGRRPSAGVPFPLATAELSATIATPSCFAGVLGGIGELLLALFEERLSDANRRAELTKLCFDGSECGRRGRPRVGSADRAHRRRAAASRGQLRRSLVEMRSNHHESDSLVHRWARTCPPTGGLTCSCHPTPDSFRAPPAGSAALAPGILTFRSRFYLVELLAAAILRRAETMQATRTAPSARPSTPSSSRRRCLAVDTWTGDSSHRSLPRGDCPRAAPKHHDPLYSPLLHAARASTFDAAVPRPSTMRLDRPVPHRRTPHLRGRPAPHFRTWLPKLSFARESSLSARYRERRRARLRCLAVLGRARERVPKLRVRPWARVLSCSSSDRSRRNRARVLRVARSSPMPFAFHRS